MKTIVKKILAITIIISLLYANSVITINTIANSIISYATENIGNNINNSQSNEEEITRIEMERNTFCKTDMKGNTYPYTENIKLNLTNINSEEIIISDISNTFYKINETLAEEIQTIYKTTRINKQELLQALGETGTIQIKEKGAETVILNLNKNQVNQEIEEEGETIQTITEGTGEEEIQIANIKAYTEYIEIEYIKEIKEIETIIQYITLETSEDEKLLNIKHTKQIGIIADEILEELVKLKTNIKYTEKENITLEEPTTTINLEKETQIEERVTKAEIAINKEELSTTLENDVQFTITLFTESNLYDLYKNPTFIIELPEEIEKIETINKNDITLVNNKKDEQDIFTNLIINQKNENEKHYIEISMQGEQQEYSEDAINNLQIVIPAKIQTSNMLPTKESQIKLYYTNENKTTYEEESQTMVDKGENTNTIKFKAQTGMITKTIIEVGEKAVENYKGEEKSLILTSKSTNKGTVKVIAVNNTNRDLTNIKILGTSEILGQISTTNTATIKYSENINATLETEDWSTTYQERAKSYLIEIETINQGEKVEFTYNVDIPEVEKNTIYEEKYAIIEETEILTEQTTKIEVKTVKLKVELETSVGDNAIYTGQEFSYIITITNEGETEAEEVSIENQLPANVSLVNSEDKTNWSNIIIPAGENIQKRINVKVEELSAETQIENKVKVNAKYLNEEIVKTVLKDVKVSKIEAKLASTISKNSAETEKVEIGSTVDYNIYLQNKTNNQQSITVKVELPTNINQEATVIKVLALDETTGFWNPEENLAINIEGNIITSTIELEGEESKYLSVFTLIDKYIEREIKAKATIQCEEQEIILEDIKNAITPPNIEITSSTYKGSNQITSEKIELSKNEELIYEITIKNTGESTEYLEISGITNTPLKIKSIRFTSVNNNILLDEENISNNYGISGLKLAQNQTGVLKIISVLPEEIKSTTELLSIINIIGETTNTKKIEMKNIIEVKETENPDEPDQPENPEDPEDPTEEKYSISGLAWLDENENGARERGEDLLSQITVKLLDTTNNIKGETQTNNNGEYIFTNIEKEDYIIVFEYNKNQYKLTTTRMQGIDESVNSDAVETTIVGETITRTDTLSLTQDLNNIDIGLIEKGIFDLEITKQISKITVQNEQGTKIIEYANTNFAKIEIPAKYYINTNIIIEYDIKIKNNGKTTGYVYSIKDIIPEGTEFTSELNTDWYEDSGNLYSVSLAQEEIKPNETKTLKLILTKQIQTDQGETITNNVEIIETFNEELLEEKDLTNNKSKAEIVIAIKTGQEKTYIIITIIFLSIITAGAYLIKKKMF